MKAALTPMSRFPEQTLRSTVFFRRRVQHARTDLGLYDMLSSSTHCKHEVRYENEESDLHHYPRPPILGRL